MSSPLACPCTFVYSVDLLRSLITRLVPPSRQTRKILFRFQLWRPAYLRRHAIVYFILILSTATSSATSSAAQAVVIHPCCYTERSLAQKEICTSFRFHRVQRIGCYGNHRVLASLFR